MAKRGATEFRARVTNDSGIVRAKVPSPLVREMRGRPGDYLVFVWDGAGKAVMTVERAKAGIKRSAKQAGRRSAKA